MFPSNFNIPMGPPIKGQNIASELYKTIAPDFRLPPQPMPEMPREDFERIKAKSDFRQGKYRQPSMQRPVGYPRPIQSVPNAPPRLNQSALDSIRERLGGRMGMPSTQNLSIYMPNQPSFNFDDIRSSYLSGMDLPPSVKERIRESMGTPTGRSYEDVVAAGGGGINPDGMFDDISPFQPQVITKGLDGKDYPDPGAAERANRIFLANQAANQPTQPTPPTGEMPPIGNNPEDSFNTPPAEEAAPPAGTMPPPVTGDPNDPMSSLYGQIGVADEAGARDVIEKILAGQSDQMTQDQRDLLSTGVYRRIANRLGIKDREGNLITPLSSVATGYDKTETPTGSQALRSLLDMEETEGGTGIEMLLNFLQGRIRPPNQGQMPPTGPFGTFPGGGSRYGMPQMPYMPQPPIFGGGFGGFGGYGGYGSPGMGGYMGMRPSLPYAGMSSPMFPSIFGMAPPSYYGGMPSMYGNYGGGFPIVNARQASNGMQEHGSSLFDALKTYQGQMGSRI